MRDVIASSIALADRAKTTFRLEQRLLVGEWTFIAREDSRPFVKESFGNWFREACAAAGVPDQSPHGIRKAAATRDAENGWTRSRTGREIRLARRPYGGQVYRQNEPREACSRGVRSGEIENVYSRTCP